jgi:methyl-accepting chemotaxis protein
MNPDQTRSSASIHALMQWEVLWSIAFPLVMFALLAFLSLSLKGSLLLYALIGGAVIVLVGVFITNYAIQRRIKNRFQEVTDVCRDYVGGDRSARVSVYGDDEFSQLCMTLNSLLDTQASSAPGAAFSNNSSDAAALQAQIEKLLQEVSAVGDGDLRVQAEVTPDTLGVLADSFNYMIEELAKVVGRVQSTAVQVTNATRRILDRSAELAQASEAQVQQISQTTEAVEALASFIQEVARNAQLSVEAAQEALRNAASGQQSVRQTIEGMMLIRENVQETSKKIKRLGERSNEIGEIVRIIEDIADQTNLLALNAAIQSAMAGENGRGFAVVADEIRLLAERSTESTKQIATLVKSIQGDTYEAVVAMEDSTQEVVKGSQLADEAGRALNSIYSAVERQAKMSESIARAANEQTSVSEAVAVAMSRISEITRQTDAGTQEAAVSVSYLAELSEQLRASVSTFRLPERSSEMPGALPAPMGELSDGGMGSMFPSSSEGQDWATGQNFSNFPPLPEPTGSGAAFSMSPRDGQFGGFGELEQGFGGAQSQPLVGAPNFSMGNGSGVQPPYMNPGNPADFQPSYMNPGNPAGAADFMNPMNPVGNGMMNPAGPLGQSPFGSNGPGFGGNNGQNFGNGQMPGNLEGFDNQQGFAGGGWYPGQQFGAMPGYGQDGQQAMNPGLLPPAPSQPGQPSPRNNRWSGGLQQNQNPFNQDQRPFRDNA